MKKILFQRMACFSYSYEGFSCIAGKKKMPNINKSKNLHEKKELIKPNNHHLSKRMTFKQQNISK